jgi:hypothetical protein
MEKSIKYYSRSRYDDSSLSRFPEDQILRSSRLTHKHPEILEIDSVSPIDYEISTTKSSLILLPLIGIEMVWDSSTPEPDPWFLPFREGIDVFELDFWHV